MFESKLNIYYTQKSGLNSNLKLSCAFVNEQTQNILHVKAGASGFLLILNILI